MSITANQVKELRERTGAGMMECKKALEATGGDMEAAIDKMRKEGMAKADKKAGRVAAEGTVAIAVAADGKSAALLELNSETDFVANGDEFRAWAQATANAAIAGRITDIEALGNADIGGITADNRRREMIAKIGENMTLRRAAILDSAERIGSYIHDGKIGVVVAMTGGNDQVARDVAVHVAANNPVCVDASGVPAELIAKEKEIFVAQGMESGKPREIVEKMVDGRVKKYIAEIALTGQAFVKNPDITVEKLLKDAGATVTGFVRFAVGEGIEKQVVDFAEEVKAQAAAAAK